MSTKLTLEYDGTRFHGWAAQQGRRTVEGELVKALGVVLGAPPKLTVAGRTDAGVHALGQVAAYEGPPPLMRSVNAILPHDVGVLAAEEAPEGFHARYDARSRSYLYRVHTRQWAPSPFERGRALWWRHRCDPELLAACAGALVGTHDFSAFTPTRTAHRTFSRTVSASTFAAEEDDLLVFRIEANAFLRSMIRVLVATMLEVAGGRRSLEDFVRLLDGAPRESAAATAPPHGLYLASVRY